MAQTILSFDISSNTIGWAVLEIDNSNNIHFVHVDYLKPIKKGHIIERLANTRDKIQNIIREYKPHYIAIENIIQFMKGKSTAKTIITLTTFNRMIGLLAYDFLGCPPALYNVMSIRHGLKLNKILPKKEDMPELVAHHLKISFPYQYNKKGKQKNENEDMADGIAVGLYHAFILMGKITPKVKKRKN